LTLSPFPTKVAAVFALETQQSTAKHITSRRRFFRAHS
jgi:hypothetical protein